MKSNQKGFSGIEGLLIVVIVAIIGFAGWWVYRSKNATNRTLTDTTNSQGEPSKSDKPATPSTTKTTVVPTSYFTIKEWGVRAPNDAGDTFTYTLDSGDKLATVVSKKLAAEDPNCTTYGAGQISRLLPTDGAYEGGGGPAVKEYAKQNPGMYTYLNGYYYQFRHDQAACSTSASPYTQNQANDAVKSLVAKFEVTP